MDDVIINKAKNVVQKMPAEGSTFMIGGLEMALYMIKVGQDKIIDKSLKYQPIMIFLTDGQPNIGYSSPPEIVQTVCNFFKSTPKFIRIFFSGNTIKSETQQCSDIFSFVRRRCR